MNATIGLERFFVVVQTTLATSRPYTLVQMISGAFVSGATTSPFAFLVDHIRSGSSAVTGHTDVVSCLLSGGDGGVGDASCAALALGLSSGMEERVI